MATECPVVDGTVPGRRDALAVRRRGPLPGGQLLRRTPLRSSSRESRIRFPPILTHPEGQIGEGDGLDNV